MREGVYMTIYVKESVIANLRGIIPPEVIERWVEKKEILIEEDEKKWK